MLDIILRTCSIVHAVHGGERVVQVSKAELILTCLSSLIESIRYMQERRPGEVSLTILDDHSDTECISQMNQQLSCCAFRTRLISIEQSGNGPSLKATYDFARSECEGLIYFVEDDYLHERVAILEMLEAFEFLKGKLGNEVVIFPCDYPDRYSMPYPSLIALSPSRYWRSVRHSTATFMSTRAILDQYWGHYLAMTKYGEDPSISEDTTINLVYREVPCFSPMPSLTVHVAYPQSLSPFVDWRRWWDEARARLS